MDDYAANEERKDFPALIITIVPTYYEGRYYMTCVNLLMFRTYKDDTGAYIELLFENKSFTINETDQIDLSAINQQIKKKKKQKHTLNRNTGKKKSMKKNVKKNVQNFVKETKGERQISLSLFHLCSVSNRHIYYITNRRKEKKICFMNLI